MQIEQFSIGADKAYLKAYLQDACEGIPLSLSRPAVLILPGGGYRFVSPAEGEPIALAYAAQGFAAFVLHYSVMPDVVFPRPQIEASEAMALIRQNAERFHVNPRRVFAVGFSAGGHLAASLAVHYNLPQIINACSFPKGLNRPDATVLAYPCITAGEYAYRGIVSEHGKNLSKSQQKYLSLENYVTKDTPPSYIFHAADDQTVPSVNSLLYAMALAKNGVPYELRVFSQGGHGFSLATDAVEGKFAPPCNSEEQRNNRKALSAWLHESAEFLKKVTIAAQT